MMRLDRQPTTHLNLLGNEDFYVDFRYSRLHGDLGAYLWEMKEYCKPHNYRMSEAVFNIDRYEQLVDSSISITLFLSWSYDNHFETDTAL